MVYSLLFMFIMQVLTGIFCFRSGYSMHSAQMWRALTRTLSRNPLPDRLEERGAALQVHGAIGEELRAIPEPRWWHAFWYTVPENE